MNSRGLRRDLVIAVLVLAALNFAPGGAAAQRKPATPSAAPQSAPAAPPPETQQQIYEHCMTLAQTHPERAFAEATRWRDHGGGYAAEHCEAVSLYGLRQFEEAAKRFHDIAEGTTAEPASLRTEAYDQAAQAWFMAQKPANAKAEFDAALKLEPKSLRLLIGRAQAEGLGNDFWSALDDLNAALDINPKSPEALVLRAAAYRHVDALGLAADDADRAISIAPQFGDAYLERGTIFAVKGDYASARKDWNKVIEMAPKSFAAQQAHANLAELAKVSAAPAAPRPAKPAPKKK